MHPFEIGMTDTASSSRRATQIELCSTADVAPGMAIKVEQSGLELAVFNVDGEFYVTDDQCTHGPGALSEGFIDGDVVDCNFDQRQFTILHRQVFMTPLTIPEGL